MYYGRQCKINMDMKTPLPGGQLPLKRRLQNLNNLKDLIFGAVAVSRFEAIITANKANLAVS